MEKCLLFCWDSSRRFFSASGSIFLRFFAWIALVKSETSGIVLPKKKFIIKNYRNLIAIHY